MKSVMSKVKSSIDGLVWRLVKAMKALRDHLVQKDRLPMILGNNYTKC